MRKKITHKNLGGVATTPPLGSLRVNGHLQYNNFLF